MGELGLLYWVVIAVSYFAIGGIIMRVGITSNYVHYVEWILTPFRQKVIILLMGVPIAPALAVWYILKDVTTDVIRRLRKEKQPVQGE